jgi:hypothetical protein
MSILFIMIKNKRTNEGRSCRYIGNTEISFHHRTIDDRNKNYHLVKGETPSFLLSRTEPVASNNNVSILFGIWWFRISVEVQTILNFLGSPEEIS